MMRDPDRLPVRIYLPSALLAAVDAEAERRQQLRGEAKLSRNGTMIELLRLGLEAATDETDETDETGIEAPGGYRRLTS